MCTGRRGNSENIHPWIELCLFINLNCFRSQLYSISEQPNSDCKTLYLRTVYEPVSIQIGQHYMYSISVSVQIVQHYMYSVSVSVQIVQHYMYSISNLFLFRLYTTICTVYLFFFRLYITICTVYITCFCSDWTTLYVQYI